jgi:hypothetical protein
VYLKTEVTLQRFCLVLVKRFEQAWADSFGNFSRWRTVRGRSLPSGDLATEIAATWQTKIDQVFGNNIEQLVRPTKDGIKIAHQAIQQDVEEVLLNVQALLEKKKAGFKVDKVGKDIAKWGMLLVQRR